MSSDHKITFAMSSVDNQETKVGSILCKCENPSYNDSHLSTEDNDSKYCDNVSHLNNEASSHIVTGLDIHSLTAKSIKNTYLCKCSHIALSYLSHLTTFSWQRRKRRKLSSTKQEQNACTGVNSLIFLLSVLVSISSFLLSPINATVSYPPESITISSYNPPYNVSHTSQTQSLVPSSDNAKPTALNWLEANNNMPSQLGEGALRSRTPRDDFERRDLLTKSIKKRICEVAGQHGECMFVWQCLKTKGKHLGMCMDGFMFGSCCLYSEESSVDKSDIHSTAEIDKHDISVSTTSASFENMDEENSIDQWADAKKRPVYGTTTTVTTTKTTTAMITKSTVTYVKPTRPTRPAKPGVRWPPSSSDFHLLQQSLSNSDDTSNEKTSNTYHQHTVQLFQPTKYPSSKPYNKFSNLQYSTSTTKPKVTHTPWTWEKVSANSHETLELPHKNHMNYLKNPPPKQDPATTNKYFPSTGSTSSFGWSNNKDDFGINKRPIRPTRPARPPKPSQIITYFPGGSVKTNSSSSFGFNIASNNRNTSSKFPFVTTTSSTQKSSSTIFPIIIRRTTKIPPTRRTTTPIPTFKPSTYPLSVFHTVTSPGDLSTTTASTPRPASVPALSASSRGGGCGEPQIKQFCPKGRIVNGTQSCYGQFPWQVSVRRTSFFGFSSTHRCGGALINELWVATAGHCVDDLLVAKIRVRIGEWDFSSTSEPLSNIERKISKKIVHPKYNFFTYENDLALLKLDKRIDFQDNIIPICLPANDDLLIGETGTVAGWGRLSEGGQLPSILQYVSVPIVSNEKCQKMFLRAGRHEVIPDIFMCAGYDTGGRDSCQGDSGGPLVVRGKSGRWFLGGIISWGIGCAEPNLPGVCTRISKFREWILDKVT